MTGVPNLNDLKSALYKKLGRVLDLLDHHCMMTIPQEDRVDFVFEDGMLAGGLFTGNLVKIHSPHSLQTTEFGYVRLFAHEYAHNWQAVSGQFASGRLDYYNLQNVEDPQNIPYKGKLFVEGSACWAAYKVGTAYGNEMMLESLVAAPVEVYRPNEELGQDEGRAASFAQALPNEDENGFRFMVHLEYHLGFPQLLHFLATGELLYEMYEGRHDAYLYTSPIQYEQVYKDVRCGMKMTIERIGEDVEKHPQCLNSDGYQRYEHTHGRRYDDDISRHTFLTRHDHGRGDQPGKEDTPRPAASLGLAHAEGVTDSVLLEPIGTIDESRLATVNFCCAGCWWRDRCRVWEACHMHSSGARSTAELAKQLVGTGSERGSGRPEETG